MNVGVVGIGYWGPNLIRNFAAHSDIKQIVACDLNEKRLEFLRGKNPSVKLTKDFRDLLKKDIDIIAISTPVETHYDLAKKALENGKHVWVEKPFTSSSDLAEDLINLADKNGWENFSRLFVRSPVIRPIV